MPKAPQLSVADAQKKLDKASHRFIENVGQWPDKALFFARADHLNYWVTKQGLTFDYFSGKSSGKHPTKQGQVVGMSFDGAKSFNPRGEGKLGFVTDYLNGKLVRRHTAHSFAGAVAKDVYPGVDFHTYYDQGKPRYDLVVAPSADPSVIRLAFSGADGTAIASDTIQLKTHLGNLLEGKLFAYQNVTGKKSPVSARFVQLGADRFGFKLGAYDRSKALVIDPLVYGTYYGGDNGMDDVKSVTTDSAGGVYMTGWTMAPDFPAIYGPYGFNVHGPYGGTPWLGRDAFVSKLQGDAFNHDYAAIIAGSLEDYGQYIGVDPHGDVWVAGRTQSSDFPGNEVYQRPNVQFLYMSQTVRGGWHGGSFALAYGYQTAYESDTVALAWNASTTAVANALDAALGIASGVTVTSTGGTLNQGATYRVSLPWNFPLLISVINNELGPNYILQKNPNPPLPRGQVVQLQPNGATTPTNGTYALTIHAGANTYTTAPINFDATAPTVQTAVSTAVGPALAGNVVVSSEFGDTLPPYLITFKNAWGTTPPTVSIDNSLLVGGTYSLVTIDQYLLYWDPNTSKPVGGFFLLSLLGNYIFFNYNDSAATVLAGLQSVVGATNVIVTNPVAGNLPTGTYQIAFVGSAAGAVNLSLDDSFLNNRPVYDFQAKTSDLFVMRFEQSQTTVLDPVTHESVLLWGGDADEYLAGFSIMPETNPQPTDPVTFAFGGTVAPAGYQQLVPVSPIPSGFPGGQAGFISKYTFNVGNLSFTADPVIPRYVAGGGSAALDSNGLVHGGSSNIDLTGVAMDPQGTVYTGGTCHYNGNFDTATIVGGATGPFVTTKGVFAGGRLLRNDDLFVQKYTPDGTMAYSALIGGNDYDTAGGLDFDLDGATINAGSSICVDQNFDLYITGISGSFNFPRTRGVYGETFNAANNVTVTKISSDASKLLYSTNLKTNGLVLPAGVGVDPSGDAFVTGNVHADWYDFPDTFTEDPTTAANPNQPNSMPLGAIQVTTQGVNGAVETALVGANPQPAGGASDIATTEGFLNMLNSSATTLLYGTYLGGALDDRVYGPFVDSFGDVWVYGWTDSFRQYAVFSSSGTPTVYTDYASLPAAMISPLAFKSTPDAGGYTTLNGILFGALSQTYPNYTPWSWAPTTTAPGYAVPTIQAAYGRDGWVDKLRINLSSVSSVTFNPSTIPGGLGASTTGTITLSQGAPTGGANIVLTLNSTAAASFSSDPTNPLGTLVVTIPAGATTATFTVYTEGVTLNTSVLVTATYQGSFSIGQFTVIPWLTQFSITPTSVVGGNAISGRVTLAALPPTGSGGITVNVLTDNVSIVNFGGNASTTVTVPEGQTSASFEIDTSGVGTISYPTITASLLGVGLTQTLEVTLANLVSVTFNENPVAGGTVVTGTVNLNGQATGPFYVYVTATSVPANPVFKIDTGDKVDPSRLAFPQGATTESFSIFTPYEGANAVAVISAHRPAQGNYIEQTLQNTLNVQDDDLTGLSILPTEVAGGTPSVGTVTIANAAPVGGVVVNLAVVNKANPAGACATSVPTTVIVPSGATSVNFPITTAVVGVGEVDTVTASRGPVSFNQSADLTVDGVTFTLSLAPSTVIGGTSGSSTGTITIPAAAPAGGLTFSLAALASSASLPYTTSTDATVPASVTIPEKATSATFTITTTPPAVPNDTAQIWATITGGTLVTGPGSAEQDLTIQQVGVSSIRFIPSVLSGRAPRNRTTCIVTLNGPSTGGNISLSSSVASILNVPATVAIAKGATSVTFTCTANMVSRTLATVVTASYGAGSAATQVVVTR
ncbi:MAG: hypothetical protein P4L46_04610 [Fimbriimonas sp.]|nr:hypothetical protein [Fimbriimonas sp.]